MNEAENTRPTAEVTIFLFFIEKMLSENHRLKVKSRQMLDLLAIIN